MGTLKWAGVLWAIWERARTLSTAHKSATTTKQYKRVVFPVACVLALLGYFVPGFADDALALGLLDVLAPLVARLALYKSKAPEPEVGLEVFLPFVRRAHERVWREYGYTVADAIEEGESYGCDLEERVIDLGTRTYTGEYHFFVDAAERARGNDQVRAAVEHLKDKKQ